MAQMGQLASALLSEGSALLGEWRRTDSVLASLHSTSLLHTQSHFPQIKDTQLAAQTDHFM
jgi:hypothetical protein